MHLTGDMVGVIVGGRRRMLLSSMQHSRGCCESSCAAAAGAQCGGGRSDAEHSVYSKGAPSTSVEHQLHCIDAMHTFI